jgi:hypothetical protein
MRAWLEILKERHPQVTWIPQDNRFEDAVGHNQPAELVKVAA